jgi:hypothetical protein
MKTMTCKQLGGACDQKFTANTFDEIGNMSKRHAMEMVQKGDKSHLDSMNQMQKMMASPDAMKMWMEKKKKEFEQLPDDGK